MDSTVGITEKIQEDLYCLHQRQYAIQAGRTKVPPAELKRLRQKRRNQERRWKHQRLRQS